MESVKLKWWEKLLGLPEEGVLPPNPAPVSLPPKVPQPNPEQLALERLVREQEKTNFWLMMQPVLMHPFKAVMGIFILYIIIHVWIYG
ncbi:hypothetical protein [Bradyrhizobium sp. HKCCYLS20291]|uniref:hypothetical protein n=1 Tax=Bradyrhizobium sp. HKCCYLS20291 TaxID=3420766 RepID=UPI003EBB8E74